MATDVFGDLSLFDEFEKDRNSSASFIKYDVTNEGQEDKSKILFKIGTSDDESSSESNSESESESETETENRDVDNVNKTDSENVEQINTTNEKVESKNTTSFKLQHERNKYKRFADLIDSTRKVADTDSPACQILFHNNKFSRKYRTNIENFIAGLLYKEMFDSSVLPELDLEPSTLTCVDINEKLTAPQRNKSMWSSHAIIGCSHIYQYFLIDTLGWPLVNFNPSLTDSWEIPKFEQCFLDPIPFDEDESVRVKPGRPKATCFNCGADHMISECPVPKDFQRIKKNKSEFLDKSGGPHGPSQKLTGSRYHRDDDPRFATFKPGQISDKLREALGLSPQQIPQYVYRMRLLGYPPGWLEEAKKQGSGLMLFDKHGKEVDITGQSMEDGEVNEERVQEPQIDPNKIMDYPGFTVELSEDLVDEHAELGFPPLQPHQLKSALFQRQEMMDAMKKRKLEQDEQVTKKKMKVEEAEMEIEDDETHADRNGEFLSPYSSSPVATEGRHKRRVPLPGNPPLPCDTPPGKPPLPMGTPPPTPEEILRRRGHTPLSGQPPLPMATPPGKPPLPLGTPPPTPDMPSPIHRQLSALSAKSGRSTSPTLDDLEKQYQLIQEKLCQDENVDDIELQVVDSIEEEEEEGSLQDLSGAQLTRQGSTTSIQTFGELGTGSPSNSLPGTPGVNMDDSFINLSSSELSKSNSISKDYGTPIYMRTVSKEKLPTASSFGQGIEDHMPFENLPDSTGSYSKMSKLIDKIRSNIKRKKR
ncbi:zinc finger CCHC domain-containing protein 8-like [Mytilus edulis]|uniref:zinc finger CCHC domain-containing protein 8-like n=1 Tax=Mytilus edulis TaxID=6550 RepID=UPI0039EEB946